MNETRNMAEAQQVKSTLKIPITYRDNPYGAIFIQQCQSCRTWTEYEVATLTEVAVHVGTVLYQAELYRLEQEAKAALQKSLEREQLIQKTTELIGKSFDIDVILKTISENMGKYLKADRASVGRYYMEDGKFIVSATAQYSAPGIMPIDPEDIELILKAVQHLTPEDMVKGVPQVTNVTDQDQYIALIKKQMANFEFELPGITLEWLIDVVKKYDVRASLRVLINYRGIPYGSINISQCTYNREWQPEEIELVKTIADHAGSAIYQAELFMKEQKARKAAEIANKKKSEFLAMMSHELRTPLNAILGYSRMMEVGMAGPVSEKQVQYLQSVGYSGQHLLHIINDLLDVSKIEAGTMGIVPEWITICPFVSELETMMVELAATKNIHFLVSYDPSLDKLYADPGRLKQILVNLINNAIKFNRKDGEVVVDLKKDAENNMLKVSVRDTGIGIPQENIPRLFEKFYQVDTTSARSQEGAGLGLALSRQLIEMHGGSIWVSSQEGVGSEFMFQLPLSPPMNTEAYVEAPVEAKEAFAHA